ncbi:MAG: GNAT family N-acetyltransferase [Candidatus Heimdallarchaeota archaeon]|nr:GNAT family N-acetyltransferase [Candidatus Heimdallarchaeota archaeon]
MSQKDKEILDVIESSMFMYNPVEGVIDDYPHDSIKGSVCPMVDHEEFNLVGGARLSDDEVDKAISELLEYYQTKGLTTVGWILSPQSQPSNLEEKLIEFDFTKEISVLGMVRSVSKPLEIETTDEFDIKIYRNEEAVELIKSQEMKDLYENAYGAPKGSAQIFDLIGDRFKGIDYTVYVAYEREENKPVAFSAIAPIPNTNSAVLNGAATLPEYRRRGLYSTFLKLRYENAKEKGLDHLIIQAKEATSAPIAAKNGFEKVCEMPIYVWRAEKTEQ